MLGDSETSMEVMIDLVGNMAVVVVVAYVITRTQSYINQILDRRFTWQNQLYMIGLFGALSVYGTISGIQMTDAVATIRDLGPSVAGLLGGPWVGLGAGLIGGIHRLTWQGEFTRIPCALSTIIIGFAAGLFSWLRKGHYGRGPGAVLFMLVAESFHMGMVLLLSRPFDHALALVGKLYIPMALANAGGMAVFALIIANLRKERKVQAERDSFLVAKERIEGELQAARDIQMNMVPHVFSEDPPWPEYCLYATVKPAREVGGDLYDFFPLGHRHLFFAIGDVSDKGVPAALFMAMTKTLLKGLSRADHPPSELLERVNFQVSTDNDALMFCTLVCGVLDVQTGEVAFANAGHNPPLIRRADGATEFVHLPPGIVLGVDPSARFETEIVCLGPGDTVVLYTDGVTEAMNSEHVLFAEQGLEDTVRERGDADPEELVAAIADAVTGFASSEPQSDDITLLVVRFYGATPETEGDLSDNGPEPTAQSS